MKLKIFLCRESEAHTPIPRHYLSPLSVCSEVREVNIHELEYALPREYFEGLTKRKTIVIQDPEAIKKILGFKEDNLYVRIVRV